VLFDDPLDECLVGMLLLAIVGDCVFQRLVYSLHRDFSHLDGLVVDTVMPEKSCFPLIWEFGLPSLFERSDDH